MNNRACYSLVLTVCRVAMTTNPLLAIAWKAEAGSSVPEVKSSGIMYTTGHGCGGAFNTKLAERVDKETATKFLGIIIDDRLNWKPHIQSVKSKLSCILSIMYKASKLITTAGMYTLYCSLFQPHISYCNELWGNTYASNVNCLCIIQRKVVRLICNADRLAHTNELFKELYILKFPEFVQYKTAIIMFHLFHGTLPSHLQNRFSRYNLLLVVLAVLIHLLWFKQELT